MPLPKEGPLTLKDIQAASHELAVEKGFYDEEVNIPEKLMLTVGELSEALEELRKDPDPKKLYYEGKKPEGFGVELADAFIRLADLAQKLDIDLEELIRIKMEYNWTRPRKWKRF